MEISAVLHNRTKTASVKKIAVSVVRLHSPNAPNKSFSGLSKVKGAAPDKKCIYLVQIMRLKYVNQYWPLQRLGEALFTQR